jgi:HAMP domain-containing protein
MTQDVVLLLSEADLPRLAGIQCQAVLVVAPDLLVLKRRITLSPASAGLKSCGRGTPVLWIGNKVANRLLQGAGRVLSSLNDEVDALDSQALEIISTGVTVTMDLKGKVQENVPVVNVIGQLPGSSAALDNEMIIVAAQYDAPSIDAGRLYPGANDNASGVAAMLEAIRTLRDSGYQPLRTFLFVAYSGEGLPDLAAAPEITTYLEARTGFNTAFDIQGVIYLRGLAVGGENTLAIWSRDNSDFSKLLSTAANLSGMETERVVGSPTMNIFVPDLPEADLTAQFPVVGLSRQGWERSARLSGDSSTFISPQDLEASGEALSLGLMILGRE